MGLQSDCNEKWSVQRDDGKIKYPGWFLLDHSLPGRYIPFTNMCDPPLKHHHFVQKASLRITSIVGIFLKKLVLRRWGIETQEINWDNHTS